MKKIITCLTFLCLYLFLLQSCGTKKDKFDFNELAKKYSQVFSAHDAAGVAKLYADDALIYQPDVSGNLQCR